jgi:hypothetical protein
MSFIIVAVKDNRYVTFSPEELRETKINFGVTGPVFHLYYGATRIRSMRMGKEWIFKAIDAFEDFMEANNRRVWLSLNPKQLPDLIKDFNTACDIDGFPENKLLKPYLAQRHQWHLMVHHMMHVPVDQIKACQGDQTKGTPLLDVMDAPSFAGVSRVSGWDWNFEINSRVFRDYFYVALRDLKELRRKGELKVSSVAQPNQEQIKASKILLEVADGPVQPPKPIDKVASAVDPSHYKGYIGDMQWLDAMSQIPTLRDPVKFEAAVELQIRKYLDRNGGKDSTIQELKKAQFYLTYLIMYKENGCNPIKAADVHTRLVGAN